MKKFKFEIVITDDDVKGDEFWEQALENDGTGITDLKDAIVNSMVESNLFISSINEPKDMVRLIEYTDND